MNDKQKREALQKEMKQYRLKLRELESERLELMKKYLKRVEELKMQKVRETI